MSLLVKLHEAIAARDCLPKTFDAYAFWARKMYAFLRTPASQWTGPDVTRFMVHLHDQRYSRSARKQALNAAAFIFRHVLKADMGTLQLPPLPHERHTLKTIPTHDELSAIFKRMTGQVRLMAALMYGSGLRVSECCHIRVQDIDFAQLTVRVHNGKGDKSRLTILPVLIVPALERHIVWRRDLHEHDLAHAAGYVELPGRLAQKYRNANRELRWQWLFPSTIVRDGYRWHATAESVAKQMRAAVRGAGIIKRVTPHTLRHAFATHAMRCGNDPRTVQDLLGHEDLNTTMIYLHADTARGLSPLDVPNTERGTPDAVWGSRAPSVPLPTAKYHRPTHFLE